MIELFERVEIIEGYREGDLGIVIELNEDICKIEFDDYEVHSYDINDVMSVYE